MAVVKNTLAVQSYSDEDLGIAILAASFGVQRQDRE